MASAASSSWFFGRRPSLGTPSASSQCNPSHASSSSQHDTSSPAYSHSNPSPGKRTPTSIPPSSLLSTSPADYSGNPGAFNDEDMRSPPPDFHDAYEEYPFVEDALKVPSFSSGMASPPSPLSHPSQHRPEPWSPLTMDLPPRSPPNPSLETAPMHPPQGQLASPSHSSASSSSVDVDRGSLTSFGDPVRPITLTPWNKPSPIYLRGLRRSHEQLGSRPRRSESGSTVGYGDFSYRHPPNERIDEREQAASRHSVSRYSGSPAVSASLTQVHVEGMLPRTDASYESFGSSSGSSVSSSERRSHWNLDPANSSHGAPREMITASPSSSSASRKKSRQQPTSSTSSTAASTPSSSSSRKLNSRRSWHSDYRPPLVPSLPSPYLYGYPYDHAPPIRQSSRYPPDAPFPYPPLPPSSFSRPPSSLRMSPDHHSSSASLAPSSFYTSNSDNIPFDAHQNDRRGVIDKGQSQDDDDTTGWLVLQNGERIVPVLVSFSGNEPVGVDMTVDMDAGLGARTSEQNAFAGRGRDGGRYGRRAPSPAPSSALSLGGRERRRKRGMGERTKTGTETPSMTSRSATASTTSNTPTELYSYPTDHNYHAHRSFDHITSIPDALYSNDGRDYRSKPHNQETEAEIHPPPGWWGGVDKDAFTARLAGSFTQYDGEKMVSIEDEIVRMEAGISWLTTSEMHNKNMEDSGVFPKKETEKNRVTFSYRIFQAIVYAVVLSAGLATVHPDAAKRMMGRWKLVLAAWWKRQKQLGGIGGMLGQWDMSTGGDGGPLVPKLPSFDISGIVPPHVVAYWKGWLDTVAVAKANGGWRHSVVVGVAKLLGVGVEVVADVPQAVQASAVVRAVPAVASKQILNAAAPALTPSLVQGDILADSVQTVTSAVPAYFIFQPSASPVASTLASFFSVGGGSPAASAVSTAAPAASVIVPATSSGLHGVAAKGARVAVPAIAGMVGNGGKAARAVSVVPPLPPKSADMSRAPMAAGTGLVGAVAGAASSVSSYVGNLVFGRKGGVRNGM